MLDHADERAFVLRRNRGNEDWIVGGPGREIGGTIKRNRDLNRGAALDCPFGDARTMRMTPHQHLVCAGDWQRSHGGEKIEDIADFSQAELEPAVGRATESCVGWGNPLLVVAPMISPRYVVIAVSRPFPAMLVQPIHPFASIAG